MDPAYTLYCSTALFPPCSQEHNLLLAACNKHNSQNQITGFLHREHSVFLQYLEGPAGSIQETMGRIGRDRRHKDLQILASGYLEKRYLPDWQMGFVDGSQLSLHSLLEVNKGELNLKSQDPFDLVVFLAANADNLRRHLEPRFA
ncbi:MAG: hypothetical protein BM558_10705 [Roseobacter sp. MedPE-SW]|nr:MAG: hypothetical protein BM558_10705 [Roseobacter sp. MedPE-SW]